MGPALILAEMWILTNRHSFFTTGHTSSFNHLQFSEAFVETKTFYFTTAVVSLFLNTFGWNILCTIIVLSTTMLSNKRDVWHWFLFYQIVETFGSCLSNVWMRQNLMLLSVFAPRFIFVAVFLANIKITGLLRWDLIIIITSLVVNKNKEQT